MNAERYFETLQKLRRSNQNKRRGMLIEGVVLLHDNARPHTARRSTHLLQEFSWEVFNQPPYCPDFGPVSSTLSYISVISCPVSVSVSVFSRWQRGITQSQAAYFYDKGYKNWSHGMRNVSIPELNILKNIPTLAVSVPINISLKLCFVSLRGAGRPYTGSVNFITFRNTYL